MHNLAPHCLQHRVPLGPLSLKTLLIITGRLLLHTHIFLLPGEAFPSLNTDMVCSSPDPGLCLNHAPERGLPQSTLSASLWFILLHRASYYLIIYYIRACLSASTSSLVYGTSEGKDLALWISLKTSDSRVLHCGAKSLQSCSPLCNPMNCT